MCVWCNLTDTVNNFGHLCIILNITVNPGLGKSTLQSWPENGLLGLCFLHIAKIPRPCHLTIYAAAVEDFQTYENKKATTTFKELLQNNLHSEARAVNNSLLLINLVWIYSIIRLLTSIIKPDCFKISRVYTDNKTYVNVL